jgi:hypothetical protein
VTIHLRFYISSEVLYLVENLGRDDGRGARSVPGVVIWKKRVGEGL